MSASASQATVLDVLEHSATLPIVREFLKAREIASSAGSWQAMREDRLVPALRDSKLTLADLLELIRECEEHGRQHVFLFDIGRQLAGEACDARRVERALKGNGLASLLTAPKLVDLPKKPEIVEVRIEGSGAGSSLVVKVAQATEHWEAREPLIRAKVRTQKWDLIEERAVSVARVRAAGLLEVRIYRQRNSNDYETPLAEFFDLVTDVLGCTAPPPLSIAKAKKHIFDNCESLVGHIDPAQLRAKNAFGIESRVTAGSSEGSLGEDPGSMEGMSAFVAKAGQHTGTFATWRALEDDPTTDDVFVALNGAPHEFAIGPRCRRVDYERVLADILKFNV